MNGEATTMSNWQPIETAPRDAFLLLLYNEQEGVCAGYWDICERPPRWIQVETQGITSAYMNPTHWMPLPDPPTSREG